VYLLQQTDLSQQPSLCWRRHLWTYPFIDRTEILRRMLLQVRGATSFTWNKEVAPKRD